MLQIDKSIASRSETGATKAYYDRNADQYFQSTVDADLSALYERFLPHVSTRGLILDAGSGSGRDTLAFLNRGYAVEAFDVSPALAARSTQLTGVTTQVMSFDELEVTERYNGIWACASLLHVPKGNLPGVLLRLARALKPGGALYVSFKHGQCERVAEDGRRFTDMDEPRLRDLISSTDQLGVSEIWLTHGEDKFKGQSSWVNAIAIKSEA